MSKSHKIILLIIGILIVLVAIAFSSSVLRSAYRLGQQEAPHEDNKRTDKPKS